jgi:2-haloacid dehalogenase
MTALPLIVFDVNETLLDLGTMEPTFERIFGEKSAMRLWFASFIMYSAALTVPAATFHSLISDRQL